MTNVHVGFASQSTIRMWLKNLEGQSTSPPARNTDAANYAEAVALDTPVPIVRVRIPAIVATLEVWGFVCPSVDAPQTRLARTERSRDRTWCSYTDNPVPASRVYMHYWAWSGFLVVDRGWLYGNHRLHRGYGLLDELRVRGRRSLQLVRAAIPAESIMRSRYFLTMLTPLSMEWE